MRYLTSRYGLLLEDFSKKIENINLNKRIGSDVFEEYNKLCRKLIESNKEQEISNKENREPQSKTVDVSKSGNPVKVKVDESRCE